jgi:hypothetical protein
LHFLKAYYSHDLPKDEGGAFKEKVECWNSMTKDIGQTKGIWIPLPIVMQSILLINDCDLNASMYVQLMLCEYPTNKVNGAS